MLTQPDMIPPRLGAGLPTELINRFWNDVEDVLLHDHDVVGDKAIRGILRYRNALDHVGGMLYHQSPEDVALAVVQGGHVY